VSAYILDASVAAKWFLPSRGEPLVQEALTLLERYSQGRIELYVPDLFWPELGNVFWKATRLGRLPIEAAEEAITSLLKLNIPTSPSGPLLQDAFTIAVHFQRSVYDAVYVALAALTNRMLVTADERLAHAMAAQFPVRWLGAIG